MSSETLVLIVNLFHGWYCSAGTRKVPAKLAIKAQQRPNERAAICRSFAHLN